VRRRGLALRTLLRDERYAEANDKRGNGRVIERGDRRVM
jgi:hypothetical protein